MFRRQTFSTSISILAASIFVTGLAVAAETPPTPTSPQCRNYNSQLAQKKRRVAQFTNSCKTYEAKVIAAEAVVAKDVKSLAASDLTKRQISRLNNLLKSHKKALATKKKYATGYCNKLNTYQEALAKFQVECKPEEDDSDKEPDQTKIIREESCDSNDQEKICQTMMLKNGVCIIQYDNTYYSQNEFSFAYSYYSGPGFQITFPSPGASAMVGNYYKIVATRYLDPATCQTP